jgi:hypothetical protein
MATRKNIRKTSRKTAKRPASNLKMSRRRAAGGGMTVREAGRLGGLIGGRKGGLAVMKERGVEFYQEIGRLGGQRVRDLIAAGRKAAGRMRHARRQHR